jgi:hypothetical protein
MQSYLTLQLKVKTSPSPPRSSPIWWKPRASAYVSDIPADEAALRALMS